MRFDRFLLLEPSIAQPHSRGSNNLMTKPDKIFLQLVFLQLCRNLSPTLGQGLDDVGGLSGQQAVAERLAQVVRRVIA